MRQLTHGIFALWASDLDVECCDGTTALCICPLCQCRGHRPAPTLGVNLRRSTGHCSRCGAGFVIEGTDYNLPRRIGNIRIGNSKASADGEPHQSENQQFREERKNIR